MTHSTVTLNRSQSPNSRELKWHCFLWKQWSMKSSLPRLQAHKNVREDECVLSGHMVPQERRLLSGSWVSMRDKLTAKSSEHFCNRPATTRSAGCSLCTHTVNRRSDCIESFLAKFVMWRMILTRGQWRLQVACIDFNTLFNNHHY